MLSNSNFGKFNLLFDHTLYVSLIVCLMVLCLTYFVNFTIQPKSVKSRFCILLFTNVYYLTVGAHFQSLDQHGGQSNIGQIYYLTMVGQTHFDLNFVLINLEFTKHLNINLTVFL